VSKQNYQVSATPDGDAVTLLLPEIGAFRMTAVGAAYLAQQLLEAANVAKPGTVGFKVGGESWSPNQFAHPSGPGVWVALKTEDDDLAAGPFDTFADAVRIMQPATYDDVFIAWVDKEWFQRRDAEIKAGLAASTDDGDEEADELCPHGDDNEHNCTQCLVAELDSLAPWGTSGRGLKGWA
jgi:hypothetical protein